MLEDLTKIRINLEKKKKMVKVQKPKTEILSDKEFQQKYSEIMNISQELLQNGQLISEKSLSTRFNK